MAAFTRGFPLDSLPGLLVDGEGSRPEDWLFDVCSADCGARESRGSTASASGAPKATGEIVEPIVSERRKFSPQSIDAESFEPR